MVFIRNELLFGDVMSSGDLIVCRRCFFIYSVVGFVFCVLGRMSSLLWWCFWYLGCDVMML